MRKLILSFLLIGIAFAVLARGLMPRDFDSDMHIKSFASLPIQIGGRIMPLDSFARNNLMAMRGKQSIRLEEGGSLQAVVFLLDLAARPEVANTYKVFRIDNDQVLGLLGVEQTQKYFSFNDLAPYMETIQQQHAGIEAESALQTTYEKKLTSLYHALTLYNQLIHTFGTGTEPSKLELEYANWLIQIPKGMTAIRAQASGEEFNQDNLGFFALIADHYLELSKAIDASPFPPVAKNAIAENDWSDVGQALLDGIVAGDLQPELAEYAKLLLAYREGNASGFNAAVDALQGLTAPVSKPKKLLFEVFFNQFEPFYVASIIYVMAFLAVAFSWMFGELGLRRTGFTLVGLAFLVHTFGLLARMAIMERPPVTNLYSSAIFVGFAGVLLAILMEKIHKQGIGTAVAGLLGFATLVVAHNLGLSGDTLEQVRAVLDSNFWLSTHVVVVTLGYSAMFLAGLLGIIYIIGNLKRSGLSPKMKKDLPKMAFGAVAFATLFSFVGTMLGGIWADQSWGRFWGWDPKENGALLIVLWCAFSLHAKLGRIVQERGFIICCVLGNIVTAWSWFGTNMLGVGLHSYGFMDAAFFALVAFVISQLLIVSLAFVSRSR